MAKSDTPSSSSSRFRIAETETFKKQLKKNPEYRRVYRKITDYVYPLLRENPYFGPNIKRLKDPLADFFRYRIGDYRLFYSIDEEEIIVVDDCPMKKSLRSCSMRKLSHEQRITQIKQRVTVGNG